LREAPAKDVEFVPMLQALPWDVRAKKLQDEGNSEVPIRLVLPRVNLIRFLLVEAAQVAMRSEPEWREHYFHLSLRRWTRDRQSGTGARTGGAIVLEAKDILSDALVSASRLYSDDELLVRQIYFSPCDCGTPPISPLWQ